MSVPASAIRGGELCLVLPDPGRSFTRVRVAFHNALNLPDRMLRVGDHWRVTMPVPDLDRVEYKFAVTLPDGDTTELIDPTNPLTADGSFGPSSWLPMPGYAAPAWLGEPVIEHHTEEWSADLSAGRLAAQIWSPADARANDRLPLLLVHDGPELAAYADLTRFVGAVIAVGTLPPLRVALLEPGDRDTRFSCDPAYAAALAHTADVLTTRWPTRGRPVVAGVSLGALAALHAAWLHPDAFGGLWLASGSYFTRATDPTMVGFAHFARIDAFVTAVHDADRVPELGPVALVCGTAEENIANNRRMLTTLGRLGAHPTWATRRDGHTLTCWRDLFAPSLADLVRSSTEAVC